MSVIDGEVVEVRDRRPMPWPLLVRLGPVAVVALVLLVLAVW